MKLPQITSKALRRAVLSTAALTFVACGGSADTRSAPDVAENGTTSGGSQAPAGTGAGNPSAASGGATSTPISGSTTSGSTVSGSSASGSMSTSTSAAGAGSGQAGAGATTAASSGGASNSGGSSSTPESGGNANVSAGGSADDGGQTPSGGNASGGPMQTGGQAPAGGAPGSGGAPSSEAGAGNGSPVTVSGCGTDISVNEAPFGCDFAWGANGNQGNRASYLDFITMWVGYEPHNGNPNGCDGYRLVEDLASTNAMAVYYAYFAGYALPDCNQQGSNNLCTDGARWIKENRSSYIEMYANYAQRTYQASPNKGVVWLLEGDFVQYTYDEQNDPFSMQELGELASDVVCAIKSNAPNAIVAINHSPWLADDETNAFWNAMPLDLIDMVWTSGLGNNNGFITDGTNANSYNGATATYQYIHNLTGKPIWVDTSFGISQADDSWSGLDAGTLNQRITDGVIAVSVTEPPGDYQSRVQNFSGQLSSVCQ